MRLDLCQKSIGSGHSLGHRQRNTQTCWSLSCFNFQIHSQVKLQCWLFFLLFKPSRCTSGHRNQKAQITAWIVSANSRWIVSLLLNSHASYRGFAVYDGYHGLYLDEACQHNGQPLHIPAPPITLYMTDAAIKDPVWWNELQTTHTKSVRLDKDQRTMLTMHSFITCTEARMSAKLRCVSVM